MQTNSYRRYWRGAATLLVLLLTTGLAVAQTPQTIIIDGVNDFLPVNVADVDTADTQFTQIDLSYVSLTNDAVNLYVGIQTGPGSFGSNQIGMAIDLKTKRPVLGNVIGGLSGPAIKPVALRMVYQVASATNLAIIGIGGISCLEDVLESKIGIGNYWAEDWRKAIESGKIVFDQ